MKETQTAIVDLEAFNEGLLRLQQLSGEVSFLKVLPIVQALQKSFIPPPEEPAVEDRVELIRKRDKYLKLLEEEVNKQCVPSPTPPKNSSKKSETNTK